MTFKTPVIRLRDRDATHNWGAQWSQTLSANTVILLFGDLGAGKTTVVQGIGHGLGIIEPIVSPTFTLINEYHEGRLPLYHFDLYRLNAQSSADLYPELYWEGEEFPPGVVAIEWPERLPYFPPVYYQLELRIVAGDERELQLTHSSAP